jgi:hypothetical protein
MKQRRVDVDDDQLCLVYDQISDRACRYYTGHGGGHNFTRLDHDSARERDLRRMLDEVIVARDEACDIAGTAIKLQGDFVGRRNQLGSKRLIELRKVGK